VSIENCGNTCLRNTIITIVFLISMPLSGQMAPFNDTVKIKEVIISRKKSFSDSPGYKQDVIDTSILHNYSNNSLSDMLSENSDISIKSYGMGGTATAAFRGTGASHTIVDWNGVNINSSMSGQSDLSLIPVGLIDDIGIHYGGASMPLNNGGIGGTINLVTQPEWNRKTAVSLNTGLGSFGQYSSLLKVRAGNSRFQSVTKGFFMKAENDFRYLDNASSAEPVWQTRTNNQSKQQAFIEELYFRNSKNVTSARVWYQNSERNLPSSMISQSNSGERQSDESFRTMISYDGFSGKSNYTITGAWMHNRLDYVNQLAEIDSRNRFNILSLKAAFEAPAGEFSKIKIVLDEQSSNVNSNNYQGQTTRNTAIMAVSAERKKDRLGASFLIREILDNQTFLLPDFSAALQFRLIDDKDYIINANVSRNSKIPAMNDMYWEPGGNPELRNEYAWMYELSFDMHQDISDDLKMKYDLAVFHYDINDMIQWQPGEYSYWTADNIQSVNTNGLETSLAFDYLLNKTRSGFKAGYSLNRAVSDAASGSDLSNDNQLIYIPLHQFNASLRVSSGKFYASWVADYTGKRYITADNSKFLDGYLLNNLNTGVKLRIKSTFIDLNFSIDNIFSEDYQTIAYFPLPGRSYNIRFLVQLIK
jgi:iron complex outermembrane receptor protein